jgi:hypothetical protein
MSDNPDRNIEKWKILFTNEQEDFEAVLKAPEETEITKKYIKDSLQLDDGGPGISSSGTERNYCIDINFHQHYPHNFGLENRDYSRRDPLR